LSEKETVEREALLDPEGPLLEIDEELMLRLIVKALTRVENLAESNGDTETMLQAAGGFMEIYDRMRFGEMAIRKVPSHDTYITGEIEDDNEG
jgi:hypothetical protein